MKIFSSIPTVLCVATFSAAMAAQRPIPAAFGPYIDLKPEEFSNATTFHASDRLVGTYYFYWYDNESKSHIIDGDGTDALTTHPPRLEGLSYKSVAWHRRELSDMIAAGIDIVFPVFWGAPSEQRAGADLHWSYEGLPPLVAAREELLREGKKPPRIGLFYDTSTLQYNSWGEHQDLTTERGRQWFYATIRDFYSLIPPKHWAMIDGKPAVLLYSAAFAKAHDQSIVDYLRAEFPKQFGGRVPWLAREISWNIKADSVVAWGGALGLKNPGGIASVGPGYDHSAVPGRTPLVAERKGGAFYESQWLKLLRRPPNFVMIETWNEWHEGTDVAESREYGRQYIELTRKYADLFKKGYCPPRPQGLYSRATNVTITLAADNSEAGLRQIDNDDGVTIATTQLGRPARAIKATPNKGRYIYFGVDDSFKADQPADYRLTVEYFDAATGELTVEYDGSDSAAPFNGAYTRAPQTIRLQGALQWRTAEFTLAKARFDNAQNRGADFRAAVTAPDFAIAKLSLRR